MKIALDISKMHKLSQSRGIGIYAQNLYEALKKYTDVDVKLVKEKENLNNFDLIHYPYFDLFQQSLNFKKARPTVVTIHDLIPIQFPNHYPPGIKGHINFQLQKIALKNVNSIITVSETVKKDVIDILKINSNKITSVYSAPSDHFKKVSDKKLLLKIQEKFKLPDEFCLYVGNVNWNKNILNISKACIMAGKNLVIVGQSFLDRSNLGHAEKRDFKEFLEKYVGNEYIKIIGSAEIDELVSLMNLAKCLILASFYEGFGLPILEAQVCGLPVITSNVSATAEIAGKGAILVNPEKAEDIAKAINEIYSSESLRKKIIDQGFENSEKFSWQKTALETVEVYKNVLK